MLISQLTIISISAIGIASGLLAFTTFLLRKKIPKTIYVILQIILIAGLLLYTVDYKETSGGCTADSTKVEFELIPKDWTPF